jgi:hypothetical protein
MNIQSIKNSFSVFVDHAKKEIQSNKFLIQYCLIHFAAIPSAIAFVFHWHGESGLIVFFSFILSELLMLGVTSARMSFNANLKDELIGNAKKSTMPDYWNDPEMQFGSYDEPNVRKA